MERTSRRFAFRFDRLHGHFPLETIGPARLSFADRGLTFATNDAEGVCVAFREPITGIEPAGVVRPPALTVTVDQIDALIAELGWHRARRFGPHGTAGLPGECIEPR